MKSITDKIADRLEAEANERGMSTRHNWLGVDGEEHGPIDPPDGEHCPKCGNAIDIDYDNEDSVEAGEYQADFACRACGAHGVHVRTLEFSRFENVEGGKEGKPGEYIPLPDPEEPKGRRERCAAAGRELRQLQKDYRAEVMGEMYGALADIVMLSERGYIKVHGNGEEMRARLVQILEKARRNLGK